MAEVEIKNENLVYAKLKLITDNVMRTTALAAVMVRHAN